METRTPKPEERRRPAAPEPQEAPERSAKADGGASAGTPLFLGRLGADGLPASVQEVVRSPGQPLDQATRAAMEPQFGHDLSPVRIHTGAKAAESAREVEARAYTMGSDIVFSPGQFAPGTREGRGLLGHELTHAVQQGTGRVPVDGISQRGGALEQEASRSGAKIENGSSLEIGATAVKTIRPWLPLPKAAGKPVLQRAPAAPAWPVESTPAAYDRSQVAIFPVDDVVGIGSGTVAPQAIAVTISAAGATHLSWELYNPFDEFVGGSSTDSKASDALTRPYVVEESRLKNKLQQGRYTLRCIARQHGTPIAYADQSFFVWTSTPLTVMDRTALGGILGSSFSHTLGEVGAAKARDMMLEHQQTLAATGTGTVMGNQCTVPTPAGVAKSDCTQYVYNILKFAFTAKGSASVWSDVAAEASRLSGSGGLRGTALQTALETKAGWKGVFWAPSPRNPEDASSEHPVAYKRVREKGLYSKDDVVVEKAESVIDYRPKSPTTAPKMTKLDQLKKVPLGVISARGGTHMTLLINGQVYEVHWDKPPTAPNVIEATPLERWKWQSGVIVMPGESFQVAFGP